MPDSDGECEDGATTAAGTDLVAPVAAGVPPATTPAAIAVASAPAHRAADRTDSRMTNTSSRHSGGTARRQAARASIPSQERPDPV